MRTRALALGVCLLLPLGAAAPAQDAPKLDPRYLEQADQIRDETLEKYAVFARWCETERMLLQARYLCNEILERNPEHEIRALSDKLRAIPPSDFKNRNRSTKKMLKEYEVKRASIDVPAAKKCEKLAAWAKKEGLAAEEEDAYVRAFSYFKWDKDVNRFLAKVGYDVIPNYGLLSKAEKQRFARVLRDVEGKFLDDSHKAYERERKSWPDAWGFETKHFMLCSNAGHEIVFPFAEECETLYEGLRLYGGTELAFRDNYKSEKLVVWLFGDETSYEVVLQTLGIAKNANPGAAGFFGPYKRSYFFWADRFYGRGRPLDEGLRKLAETFYHEGTHQMMALQLDVKSKGGGPKYKSFWCVEAIANYMETMEVKRQEDGAKKFTFGFPHSYEGFRAANSHLIGAYFTAHDKTKYKFVPLKVFTTNSQGGYMANGADSYNQAMGLAHYLNHAEGGKHKATWFEYIRQEYTLGGSAEYLWDLCGVTEEALSAAYVDWVRKLKYEPPSMPPGGPPGGQPGQPPAGQPPGGQPPGGQPPGDDE